MAKNIEHYFMYSLAICTSFENCLFNSFAHLLIGLLGLIEMESCGLFALTGFEL
jgi:hypothetical protein